MKMPKLNSYADVFRRWDKMLAACEHNAALLPGVDDLKAELKELRDRLQQLKEQQEHLTGHRESMTQRVLQTRDAGQEAFRKLAGFVLSRLGTREELLKQFGLSPNRSRKTPRLNAGETPDEPVSEPVAVVATALTKAGVPAPAEATGQPSPPAAALPAESATSTNQTEEPK
jgi:hypothetical protein